MKYEEVIRRLEALSDPKAVERMARFGIRSKKVYGISSPALRSLAKEVGKDHLLAQKLWRSGFLEARVLASLIDDPQLVSEARMDRWVMDFDSWSVCDSCCQNLFHETPFAYKKAKEWSKRKEEFVKRAGFVLMAELAIHDKRASDKAFIGFLPLIKRGTKDGRNFVRKAVNWALRQIGKRNRTLNQAAIQTALEIKRLDSKTAHWVAADALWELKSEEVQRRLRR